MNRIDSEHKQNLLHFNESLSQCKKDTLWKIEECNEVIKTRINETKVNEMVANLDKRLSNELEIVNEKLLERMAKANSRLKQDLDSLTTQVETSEEDTKKIIQHFRETTDECVLNNRFQELVASFHNLKNQIDDENSTMHGVIREQKDKMSEVIKKFKLAQEKMEEKLDERTQTAQPCH